jgi:hypothetical protein
MEGVGRKVAVGMSSLVLCLGFGVGTSYACGGVL